MPIAQSNTTSSSSSKPKANRADSNKNVDQILSDAISQDQESREQTSDKQSSSTGNKTPQEQPEFIKQALIIIEKKVRNLDKRRMKLEEYRATQKKGENLNEDQLSAVSRYDEVLRTLELTREMEKQFVGLANDAMKQQKKQIKKEQIERDEAAKEKFKEAQKFLSVLDKLGDNDIRKDFLNEANGACKITDQELNLLDQFDELIRPCELGAGLDAAAGEVADHLICLTESKNKVISQRHNNASYSELKKLLDRIIQSPYWSKEKKIIASQKGKAKDETVSSLSSSGVAKEKASETITTTTTHHQQHHQHQDEHRHLEQGVVYHQQNTSDDFVLVSQQQQQQHVAAMNVVTNLPITNELVDSTQKLQLSPSLSQQQQQKTFFTTLNPAELSTQFLSRSDNLNEEGLNFLQDSEIQHQIQSEHYKSNHVQSEQNFQEYGQSNEAGKNNNGNNNSSGFRNSQPKGGRDFNGRSGGGFPPRQKYNDDRRNNGPRQSGPYNNNRNQNGVQQGGSGGNRSNYNQGGNRGGSGGQSNYYRPSNTNNSNTINNNAGGRPSGNQRGSGSGGGFRNQQEQQHNQTPIIQN